MCDAQDAVVVEVNPRNGIVGTGPGRLFLQADHAAFFVEFSHAVPFRVLHPISENSRARFLSHGVAQQVQEAMAVEQVVAQTEGNGGRADEIPADDERLSQTLGPRLYRVCQFKPKLGPVSEEPAVGGEIFRRGYDQDFPNPRQHQCRQGIVDHRLVVDGEQMLADGIGDRIKAGAAPARQDDSLHFASLSRSP